MTVFPDQLRSFLDDSGRLRQWPAKRRLQLLALEALAGVIPTGRQLTEREINELLNGYHTFKDPAMLRRYLFDLGYLDRKADGTAYWRKSPATQLQ